MQPLELTLNACTGKQAQLDNTTAIIKWVTQCIEQTKDPRTILTNVAILSTFANSINQALEILRPRAYDVANTQIPEAKDGTNFTYEGNVFCLKTTIDYNYAANDTANKDYARIERRIDDLNEEIKSQRRILKGYKAEILRLHPNMVPTVKHVTVAFQGTELELKKVE